MSENYSILDNILEPYLLEPCLNPKRPFHSLINIKLKSLPRILTSLFVCDWYALHYFMTPVLLKYLIIGFQ
jgi:hypothetical protein